RLERDGYVKRVDDEKDRRVTNVFLTNKGVKIVNKFRDNIKKRWHYILSKMSLSMGETQVNIIKHITDGFKNEKI
ncbi:MAG: DNA-binding MarR family transcriptional regulator, partial [Candidatus Omnitrophota bacterium]